jgi:Mrp family chromosome partitioning ATPase
MSRNFELFQRLDSERKRLNGSADGNNPRTDVLPALSLNGVTRTELQRFVDGLYLYSSSPAPRTLLFTGLEPGSASSWVCAHTSALMAATLSTSVCLVDGNLRNPSLHRRFGVPNQHGLTDLVIDAEKQPADMATQVRGGDLWLLTSGSTVRDCESILQSQRLRESIDALRTRFDFILIDSPSISTCRDALALGQLADGVVLILSAETARREASWRLKQEFDAAGVKIFGAILNDHTGRIQKTR